VMGPQEKLSQGIHYLIEKGLSVEIIGYVHSAL
jgi:hypothetical protein